MEATASAKYLRGSAQKARLVVDMIRGKDVNQALAILRFSKKRAANGIEKCMRSAIANANEAAEKANISIDPDDLWVRTAFVDRGPTKNRRRVRPAPQGRAYREQRHFCHITISLSNDAKPEPKATKGATPTAPSKPAKLAESKGRKRGGAAAAPRAKKVAPKAEVTEGTEKPSAKKASKKKAEKSEE
ncbi:MAG TPA: 50S ribosomal protein L22 [Pyrinomonadaceae bacterium]|jgi:ribosomal protein L22, bacterial type|nr:50S ribosomal protein L22 [Pyrinomonadaceae bacterium]